MLGTEFDVKIASPSDYKQIVRLCKRAVGPDDYVIPRARDVISKKSLFLAMYKGELVGMSNFSITVDNVGWLGMARTDPKWRRHGVAIFLQRAKAAHAKKLGIKKLRLFVLSTNTPSLRATMKGGFKPVSEAAHLTARIPKSTRQEGAERFKGRVENLLSSTFIAKMKGYVGYDDTLVKAKSWVLEKVREEIFTACNSTFIMNSPDKFEPGSHREFSLLGGTLESSLLSAIRFARKLGSSSIGTFLPYEPYAIRTARKQGFISDDWGWHLILLEKKLNT